MARKRQGGGKRRRGDCHHTDADLEGLYHVVAASPDDTLELAFRHMVASAKDEFVGPQAIVVLGEQERRLQLQFAIGDPHLRRVLDLLGSNAGSRGGELRIEFSSQGRSYGELFEPVLGARRRRAAEPFEVPLVARIGLRTGKTEQYGKPLFGAALALLVTADGYLFDCHSHWSLTWRTGTTCHGTGTCVPASKCQCLDYDLKLYPTCTGWRPCFC